MLRSDLRRIVGFHTILYYPSAFENTGTNSGSPGYFQPPLSSRLVYKALFKMALSIRFVFR